MMPTPRGDSYLMPAGKVAALYRHHSGAHALTLATVPGDLDAVASRTGNTVYVHAVNTRLDRAVRCTPTIAGEAPRAIRAIRMSASDPFAEIQSRSEEHTSELQSLMRKSYAV